MQITCFDGVAICIEGLINATPKYQVYGIRNNMFYNFYFHKLHKGWKRSKASPTVSYQTYTQHPNPCVAKTLDEYISRTEGWRPEEECFQLLLGFVDPHKPVVSSTISGW